MCGGFTCSKNTLIGLNIVYILISFLLIGVATYAKTSNVVTSLPIVGGIVASGVFLLFISLVGLVGAVKHHQIMLFFYMAVLFTIFVIQFSVSCACLAVDTEEEIKLAQTAWEKLDNNTKFDAENTLKCCGFKNTTKTDSPECGQIDECKSSNTTLTYACPTCKDKIESKINYAFNSVGGVGLFFAFTEFAAIVYAHRFRTELRTQTIA